MYFRKIILLLLLLFVTDRLFAATFTVISNADSGPGTLRQALSDAAANGTATMDYIYFNLPGFTQADVTINLQSQLPDVTANVVIDGTTQPTLPFGVSDARVIITTSTPAQNFNAFNVSISVGMADAVQFYGLYITGFGPNQTGNGAAIYTTANCQLVVGAPGKGNVITNNYCGVYSYMWNATIQSNFFGVEPDGVTPLPNALVISATENFNNLQFGGPNANEGNIVISGGMGCISLGAGQFPSLAKTLTIQNNYFGINYNATNTIASPTAAAIPFIQIDDAAAVAYIKNNIFSATETAISVFHGATIFVTGNDFGTNATKTLEFGTGNEAIIESGFINATIGGTTAADQNVFTDYKNPIFATGSTTAVIQNSFYCNQLVLLTDDPSGVNFIRVTSITAGSVSGDAPPGATVQLYYTQPPTDPCQYCNPKTWFGNATADGAGKWTYNGPVTGNVLASSTTNNNTVGFNNGAIIQQSEVAVTNVDCHHAGSFAMVEPRTGFQFNWTNASGTFVSASQNPTGLAAGTYNLTISEPGGCPSETGTFSIIDVTPKVFGGSALLDCSSPTAPFDPAPQLGPGFTVAEWHLTDQNGNAIPGPPPYNLPAGTYSLYIKDSNGCLSNTATYTVNPPVNAPVIDETNAKVKDADCAGPNGAVTGITITNQGSANIGWAKADGTLFSSGVALTGAPPGQYYLYIDYQFGCPEVRSSTYTIVAQNVVTLDQSAVVTKASTCQNNDGAITGMAATGATTYAWYNNATKNQVGNSLDLTGVPSGTYYFIASNAVCNQQSQNYTISNTPATTNFPGNVVENDATCGQPNGSIFVNFDPSNSPSSYRWTSASGTQISANGPAQNLGPGTYNLLVTDNNGCESLYNTYTVKTVPLPQIQAGSAVITNDQCGQNQGSIQGVTATGGVSPYTFNWLYNGNQSVSTDQNVTGLAAGSYTLVVTDASGCTATQNFTVTNESATVPPPQADNLQICSPGPAILQVKNPQAGYGYRLYATAISTDVLQDNSSGVFQVNVPVATNFYISEYSGTCESTRLEVSITLGTSDLTVPNTFTPNNDGINDYWVIKGIENYPQVLVQIFNRYGQKVFESKGYSQPFDGTLGGSPLQPGVYYYIINLNSNCNLLSGSLTLLK